MRRLFQILILVLSAVSAYSQDTLLKGVVNEYYAVSSLVNGSNSVTCLGENLSSLKPGDKVVLIQMTGGDIMRNAGWLTQNGDPSSYNASGRYEFLAVSSVNDVSDVVVFTANLKRTYSATEKVQLVKMVEAENAIVTEKITATAWDGVRGGVVAIVTLKKLVLQADIDVSGQGFLGAAPINYTLSCRPDIAADTFYFETSSVNKSGLKGEGVMTDTFSYTIGMGNSLNGGGGGYGYYGGGGGGSNYNAGGRGGTQEQTCSSMFPKFGQGGIGLGSRFYDRWFDTIADSDEQWAIAMGGGGGSSTQNAPDVATSGGNGGGIVILLTDTLFGNSNSIRSNGSSVDNVATAGGGGGGGSGTIIVDASIVSSNVTVQIVGGKGGDTQTNCGGAGGGGSGGVFWHNDASPSANITISSTGGAAGQGTCGAGLQWGASGSNGQVLSNYEPLLNGFSFNAISGIDTICQGQAPNEIYGSIPKGVEPFTFNWLSSADNSSWTNLSVNTKNYQPDTLYQTTYFTRVITNGDGVHDTAISVRIHVWDSISDNMLQLRDTLCFGDSPDTLKAKTVSGGNNVFMYSWESKTNSGTWTNRDEWNNIPEPSEGILNESTYYRRTVVSAKVCSKVSPVDTLTVHPLIQNNSFLTPDTTICEGKNGGVIWGTTPTGGLQGSYQYSWLVGTQIDTYFPIAGSDSTISSGALPSTRYYKRIVYSGSDSACTDTTKIPKTITVLQSITGNNISIDSAHYCSGDTPGLISGGGLTGGEGGVYSISWWLNSTGTWIQISGESLADYQPEMLTDTTRYRRRVSSGDFDACIDISNTIRIDVVPAIVNTIQSPDENVCENSKPVQFNELASSGGAGVGTYNYLWLEKSVSSSMWSPASIAEGPNNNVSYIPPGLSETTQYKRRVLSHICADTGKAIQIVVYPKIAGNSIIGNINQYTCYNSPANILGSAASGGKPNEAYSYFWQASDDNLLWKDASGEINNSDYLSDTLLAPEYFRRIIHSGELAQCKDTTAAVFVQLNPLPSGDILSKIDTLCEGSEISIDYTVNGNGPWTFELGESSVIHVEPGVGATTGQIVFPLNESANIKVLNIIDDSLCFANLSLNTGVAQATVYEVPVANAGEDFEICGLDAQLNANPSVGKGKWTTSDVNITNDSLPNTNVKASTYGSVNFKWTENNWRECIDEDEVTAIFYEQPLVADAGNDILLQYEFVTQLGATSAAIGSGHWTFLQGMGVLADSAQSNTEVTIEDIGEYVLQWKVENGVCTAISDSISLKVFDLRLYGGFSPNNDGVNDVYTVDLSEESSATLLILDKNGNRVKQIDGVGLIQWDGTNDNEEQVPGDTYFYILTEEGRQPRSGYIELRR